MPHRAKNHYLLISVILSGIAIIFLLRLDLESEKKVLTFAMLDVGQGDALFIESPTGTQVLVDAGPPRKIKGALAKIMSPFDRTIDMVIITNPDTDHIGGLSEILQSYEVGVVFEPGTLNDSKTFQNVKREIKEKRIPSLLAQKGTKIDLGGGAAIEILFPDRDVRTWATNEGSVVARLTYGETSAMLTGDSTAETEKLVMSQNSQASLKSDILKVGHHGSRSSTTSLFVKAVAPDYALISDGKDNNYGHPHKETLKTLDMFGAKVLRTDLLGSVIMISDGKKEEFSFHR